MCYSDQYRFACGDWKWGEFRRHCLKVYRMDETCGMKHVWQTFPVGKKCWICDKIDSKMKRRAAEVNKLARWQTDVRKFRPSIDKAMRVIRDMDTAIYELSCECERRGANIGGSILLFEPRGAANGGDASIRSPEEKEGGDVATRFELIDKIESTRGLPITFITSDSLATVMAIPDSGSNRNFMSYDLAIHLGFELKSPSSDKEIFKLLDGGTVSSVGVVRASCGFGLTFDLDRSSFRCVFRVLRDLISPLILSLAFLNHTETFTRFQNRLIRLPFNRSQIPRIRALGTSRSRLHCSINGNNAKALVDSGSDIDVVSLKYAMSRGWTLRSIDQDVLLADGRRLPCAGICDAQLSLGRNGKIVEVGPREPETSSGWGSQGTTKAVMAPYEGRSQNPSASVSPQNHVRHVIQTSFYVLDGIMVDVVLGASSTESLQVFSHHTDALTRDLCDDVKSVEPFRISLVKKLRSFLKEAATNETEEAISGHEQNIQRQLSDADQRENAQREAADIKSATLTGEAKLEFDRKEEVRRRVYDEVRAQLLRALSPPP